MENVNKLFRFDFILILFLILIIQGCSGMRPKDIGVKDGKFKACPGSPNCVSTQSADPEHRIDPIIYTGSISDAMDKLVKVINSMERTKIITRTDDYLYAEFKSKLMGYVDDVEFYFVDGRKTIEFRSASRLGYSDLGVNRKRMEDIRKLYNSN